MSIAPSEPRSAFLYPGKNGIETSVAITDVLAGFSTGRNMLKHDKVKEIFHRLNAGGVRYALIGGLAYAQYAPPRATRDIDLLVLAEDVAKVRELFPGSYLRGTAIAGIYEFEGTRFDVQPAQLRSQVAAVKNAVGGSFEGEPIKVASLPDLLYLKLWASTEREEKVKRARDQVDIAELLEHNAAKISAQDIAGVARSILALGYTSEAAAKYKDAVRWLNQTLDELQMSDRKFTDPL